MLLKKGSDSTGQLDITTIWYVPVAGVGSGASQNCDYTAVGATATDFPTLVMLTGHWYAFSANTDCWIQQGATPTAAKAAGSMFVSKGTIILIDGAQGPELSVVQDSASGAASLVEVTV